MKRRICFEFADVICRGMAVDVQHKAVYGDIAPDLFGYLRKVARVFDVSFFQPGWEDGIQSVWARRWFEASYYVNTDAFALKYKLPYVTFKHTEPACHVYVCKSSLGVDGSLPSLDGLVHFKPIFDKGAIIGHGRVINTIMPALLMYPRLPDVGPLCPICGSGLDEYFDVSGNSLHTFKCSTCLGG